jgi:hypothetical protein
VRYVPADPLDVASHVDATDGPPRSAWAFDKTNDEWRGSYTAPVSGVDRSSANPDEHAVIVDDRSVDVGQSEDIR